METDDKNKPAPEPVPEVCGVPGCSRAGHAIADRMICGVACELPRPVFDEAVWDTSTWQEG